MSAVLLATLICGCGANGIARYDCNMKKYVSLPEKEPANIEASKDFEEFFSKYCINQVAKNGATTKNYEAEVEKGNSVGITIKSALSAEEQAEIVAGDTTFKYGEMANEIIGKKAGDEFQYELVNIDKTTVLLTVKIEYVYLPEFNEASAVLLGFENLEDAEKALEKEALEEYALNWVVKNSEIKDYPEKEYNELLNAQLNYHKQLASGYGLSLEKYREKNGLTEKQFNKQLEKAVKSEMDAEMPIYAFARSKKIELSQEDIDNKLKQLAEQTGVSVEVAKEQTTTREIELLCIKRAVAKEIISKESK